MSYAAAARPLSAKYLVYLPAEYEKSDQTWPVIVYLHGGSVRGEDIGKLRALGLPRRLDADRSFPFIVVSPLCPAGEIWTDVDTVIAILDEVLSQYRGDRTRVYLTGHSMGGRGALYFAFKRPDRFAAVLALSAVSPILEWAPTLAHIPIRYFHGVKDREAPVADGDALVRAVEDAGGQITYTRLEDADHFLLDTYFSGEWYQWFLRHRR